VRRAGKSIRQGRTNNQVAQSVGDEGKAKASAWRERMSENESRGGKKRDLGAQVGDLRILAG
jgi:hypothetical protein